MDELTIALAQMEISINLEKNLEKIISFIKNTKSEIILFPELALTGYRDLANWSKDILNSCIMEIKKYLTNQVVLLGAPNIDSHNNLKNAYFYISKEEGKVLAEKELLFPGLDDKVSFVPGEKREIFSFKGKTLGVLICFELRAPELARAYLNVGVDGLIIPAQWPESRIDHFHTLVKARAIENQVFTLGVNGVGKINDLALGGESIVYSPTGDLLLKLKKEEDLKEIKISLEIPRLPYPLKTPQTVCKKYKTLEEMLEIAEKRRKKGQIMVFTNGCFDILHAGHVDYLQRARKLGDFLVVGLNSDISIKTIKGGNRPINSETYRKETLAGLSCVDYIVLFDEETPEFLIRTLKPDILVKGADWEENQIVGADFVKSYKGLVKRIEFNFDISTSKLIEKIKKLKES